MMDRESINGFFLVGNMSAVNRYEIPQNVTGILQQLLELVKK
jgi:hypothetical protein